MLKVVHSGLESLSGHVISRLQKLRTLDVSDNKLGTFPPVGQWTQLRVLLIHGNDLTSLPEGITDLPRLERFDFAGNRIATISLGVLRKLPWLPCVRDMPTELLVSWVISDFLMKDGIVPTVA